MAKWSACVPLRDESRGALRNAYCAMMRTLHVLLAHYDRIGLPRLRPLDDGGIDAR